MPPGPWNSGDVTQEGTATCSRSPRKGGRDGQLVLPEAAPATRAASPSGMLSPQVGCCPPRWDARRRPLGGAQRGRVAIGCGGRGGAAPPLSGAAAEPGPAPLQQAAAAAERPRRAGQGRAGKGRAGPGRREPRRPLAAAGRMIGVNSINSSAGRMRSRSMCSVRYGRNYRGVETFCYGWPQRSRTLKPVLYTDLVVSRIQSRRKKKPVSGGKGERGAPRGDALRPEPRRGHGRVNVPGQSPSRPLQEPLP